MMAGQKGNPMTPETKEVYYKLLEKKHEKTDWSSAKSVKEFNEYRSLLKKLMEDEEVKQ